MSIWKWSTKGRQLSAVSKHTFIKRSVGDSYVKRVRQACLIYLWSDDGHKSSSPAGLMFLLLTMLKDHGGLCLDVAGPAWNKPEVTSSWSCRKGHGYAFHSCFFYQICYTLWSAPLYRNEQGARPQRIMVLLIFNINSIPPTLKGTANL